MSDRSTCQHRRFEANVKVVRLEDIKRFVAEVRVTCDECGEQFMFLGVPPGFDFERPMVSLDGLELRAPIEPEL